MSFIPSLNARGHLKERSTHSTERKDSFRLPTLFSGKHRPSQSISQGPSETHRTNTVSVFYAYVSHVDHPYLVAQLQINVEKTVHCVTDITESDDAEVESMEPAYSPRRSSGEEPFSNLAKV